MQRPAQVVELFWHRFGTDLGQIQGQSQLMPSQEIFHYTLLLCSIVSLSVPWNNRLYMFTKRSVLTCSVFLFLMELVSAVHTLNR